MLGRDEEAVTDVIGSILLVAITVSMMVGLSLVVLSFDGPEDEIYADLRFSAYPGLDGWGSGDEVVRLQHRGGEEVKTETAQIVVILNDVPQLFQDADLDGGFIDGTFTIGETWERTFTIGANDTVRTRLIYDARQLLVDSLVHTSPNAISCGADATAPTVSIWQQSPSDVTDLTIGPVTVTVTLTDDCSGPDDGVAPSLQYRINNGTDPGWTDTGAMTSLGAGQWSGSIPGLVWATYADQTLEYRLINMTDVAGNSGTSIVRSDVIADVEPIQYPDSFSEVTGSVIDFNNLKSASDSNAAANLVESNGIITLYGTAGTGSGATNPANAAGSPDDLRATIAVGGDQVTVSGFNTAGQTQSINKVELVVEGQGTLLIVNDVVDLIVNAGGGYNTVDTGWQPGALTDSTRRVDITAQRGTWTWADVAALGLRATYNRVATEDSGTFLIDSMYVEVTSGAANDLNVEMQFPTLVAGTNHTLELRYLVGSDTFALEVWDGGAWNQRASLTSTSFALVTYELTLAESTSAPLIRFVDVSGTAPPGTLSIDYVRVVTT